MRNKLLTVCAAVLLAGVCSGCGGSSASGTASSQSAQQTSADSAADTTEPAAAETTEPAAAETTKVPETTAAPETTEAPAETTAPETEPPVPETDPPAERKTYGDYYESIITGGSRRITLGDDTATVPVLNYLLKDINNDGWKELIVEYDLSNDPVLFYHYAAQQCFWIENGTVKEGRADSMQHTVEQYFAEDGNGLIEVFYRPNGGGYALYRSDPIAFRSEELGEGIYGDDDDAYNRMQIDMIQVGCVVITWYNANETYPLLEYVPE